MQLAAPASTAGPPAELAAAIRQGATRLGHRPAVTQLLPTGRQEQSVASLAQWAAKGAHFLQLEAGLRAGEFLHLAAPPGWTTAAVALGAWWAGIGISLQPRDGVEVAVVHAGLIGASTSAEDVLWIGDGLDGAPLPDPEAGPPSPVAEAWVRAVQSFPDQPPAPHATAGRIAVRDGDRAVTQAELIALAMSTPDDGSFGIEGPGPDAVFDLAALCVRPLVVGRPTVVCRDVPRSAAEGEKVVHWR